MNVTLVGSNRKLLKLRITVLTLDGCQTLQMREPIPCVNANGSHSQEL
jgi:hypothetical protein